MQQKRGVFCSSVQAESIDITMFLLFSILLSIEHNIYFSYYLLIQKINILCSARKVIPYVHYVEYVHHVHHVQYTHTLQQILGGLL